MALQILESNVFFVDTSVFLRYLTADSPAKAAACKQLFERAAQGEVRLTTSGIVVFELVHALASPELYGLQPRAIRQRLHPLLNLENLRLEGKAWYLRGLELFCEAGVPFAEAVIRAEVEQRGLAGVYSYSGRLAGLERSVEVRQP